MIEIQPLFFSLITGLYSSEFLAFDNSKFKSQSWSKNSISPVKHRNPSQNIILLSSCF